MSAAQASPSNNGRGSKAWSGSWTHVSVDRRSAGYCRVTFDHPPINAITATTVWELAELVDLIEQDPDLNVVVFDSANPDVYLADQDGPSGMSAWVDLLVRLARAPVVSIASIRGRVRGAGSEFVLACDMRFASRENTLLGPFDVGVSRSRALEILLVADSRLDAEVEAIASRLARFDHAVIARSKSSDWGQLGV